MEVPIHPPRVQLICQTGSQNSKRTFYLLDYRFIIIGCNLETARWKREHRVSDGKRAQASTPTWKLRNQSFWVFMEVSLHRHDGLNHWPLVSEFTLQPLSPPQRAPTSLRTVIAATKLKDACPWKKSYDRPRQRIKKQRHHFANKSPDSESYGFSSSHVDVSWTIKKAEHWGIDAF